ncbi:MAG TPA: hypothetical protein VKG24_10295 [Pseudolabrys sp.]|nr:hypothetical protein [Pseudolabrys sp.]
MPSHSRPASTKDKLPNATELWFRSDGELIRGWYWVDEQNTVTASNGIREKSTQVGGTDADRLARLLLIELREDSKPA